MNERTANTFAIGSLLIFPFLGVELCRVIYEIVLGRYWYFISSNKSTFFAIGLSLALVLAIACVKRSRKRFNALSLFLFAFFILSTYSIIYSFLATGIDQILLKQLFYLLCSIAIVYLAKSFNVLNINFFYLKLFWLVLLVVSLLVSIAGAYPFSGPHMFGLSSLFLILSSSEKSDKTRQLDIVYGLVYLIVFILGSGDINRSLLIWLVLLFGYKFYIWTSRKKNMFPVFWLFFITLFSVSLFYISENIKVSEDNSKTLNRIASIIWQNDDYVSSESLNDRKLENEAVLNKFTLEGSDLNYLFGFGASASYDVWLARKRLPENKNVHTGPFYELLKRGSVGVIIQFSIILLMILFTIKNRLFFSENKIEFLLAWYFLLCCIFFMTWADSYYTSPALWLFYGYCATRTSARKGIVE